MSLEELRECYDEAYACEEVAALLATIQVTIRTRTWSGARVGQGTTTDSDLVLPKQYPSRMISAREVASSGGRFRADDIVIDEIPKVYTRAQLAPTGSASIQILYVVTGDDSGVYTLVSLDSVSDTLVHKQMVLRRTRATP